MFFFCITRLRDKDLRQHGHQLYSVQSGSRNKGKRHQRCSYCLLQLYCCVVSNGQCPTGLIHLLCSYIIIVAVSAAISWVVPTQVRQPWGPKFQRDSAERDAALQCLWRWLAAFRTSSISGPTSIYSAIAAVSSGLQCVGRTVGMIGRSADVRAPHGRVQRKQQTPYSAAPQQLTTYIVIVICY